MAANRFFALHVLNYYLLLLLSLFLLLIIRDLLKNKLSSLFVGLDKADFIFLLLTFSTPVFIGLLHIQDYSLWLDEYIEYQQAFLWSDLVQQAALVQQPPLGLLFRRLGLIFFGTTEFGLRVSSVFFSGLFGLINYVWIKDFSQNRLYSLLGSLFVGLNYWLLAYSIEARPYTISLFFCALFLYFLTDHLTRPNDSKKINLYLTTSAVLWLLSISMQPLLFISLLIAMSLFVALVKKTPKWLSLFFSLMLSFIIYLPFLYLIVKKSTEYLRPSFLDTTLLWPRFIEDFWFIHTLFVPNKVYLIIIFLMLSFFIAACLFNKKSKKIYLTLGATVGLYLFITLFSFYLKINWGLSHRYLLTVLVLVYYLFLFSFFSLVLKRAVKTFILLTLVSLSCFSIFSSDIIKPINHDWRGLYTLMQNKATTQSRAYVFSFESPGRWHEEVFVAPEFYLKDSPQIRVYNNIFFPFFMTNNFLFQEFGADSTQVFFVIMRKTLKEEYFDKLILPNTERIKLTTFYLLSAQRTDLLALTKGFYTHLEKLMCEDKDILRGCDENILRIYDGLFLIALYEKNCLAAQKNLDKFIALFNKDVRLHSYFDRLQYHKKSLDILCKK